MWKHQVISMTVVTGGCYHQSRFEKTSSMDTLGVVLNYIMLGDIIDPGHNLTFLVALSTEVGDIHFIGTRIHIGMMQDIMMSMAFHATGSIWIVPEQGLTMYASCVV
jgi:hypothetical protein